MTTLRTGIPPKGRDFVHDHFRIPARHPELIRDLKLPAPVAEHLSEAFRSRYEDPEKPFPGSPDMEPERTRRPDPKQSETGNGAVYRIPVNKQILRVPTGIDINPILFGRISDPDYRQSLLP